MLTESNPPQQISRKDYAEKFSQNLAVVWLDRIASFGTVAVEAMASGCIPIGITPDITPDYLLTTSGDTVINNEFAGYWSSNVYDIPLFLNQVIIESFDDRYDDDYLVNMQKIAETYKASNIVEETLETYEDFINQRIGVLENALKEIELNEEKLEETSNNENNLQTKEKWKIY
jgi:glycosyltransferase involved in cell wall biosynthesis